MPDMIPVKIRPLSGEAFRPYGQVLERGGLVYPDTDDGRVAMEMLQVRRRPDANQIAQLAIHFSYNQTFIPVQGSMVLVVAPPQTVRAPIRVPLPLTMTMPQRLWSSQGRWPLLTKVCGIAWCPWAPRVRLSTSPARTRRSPPRKRAMKPAWSAFTRRDPMSNMSICRHVTIVCSPWNGEATYAQRPPKRNL